MEYNFSKWLGYDFSRIGFANPYRHETQRKTGRVHAGITKSKRNGTPKKQRKIAEASRKINRRHA